MFNENRDFIEAIARDEFEGYGAADDDFYKGRAVVWIYPDDVERALAAVRRPQAPSVPSESRPNLTHDSRPSNAASRPRQAIEAKRSPSNKSGALRTCAAVKA
jgi:hypothetical protein